MLDRLAAWPGTNAGLLTGFALALALVLHG
jgi:hypothetical protein